MGSATRRRFAPPQKLPLRDPRLKLVRPVEDPAVDAYLSRRTVEASLALRGERGEVFRQPMTKDQPHQTLDELDIMLSRGEITRQQFEAGRRYGDLYRQARVSGAYRSSLQLGDGVGAGANRDDVLLRRVTMFAELQGDRKRAWGCNKRIVALCDAVLGDDYLIDNGAGRAKAVEVLSWALTRLAYNYGILWWRDDAA